MKNKNATSEQPAWKPGRNLFTLADYFEKENPVIDQTKPDLIIPDSDHLTEEQTGTIREFKQEQGAAIAAIAAGHFRCAPKAYNGFDITRHFKELEQAFPNIVLSYKASDGRTAICRILRQGLDFRIWYRKYGYYKTMDEDEHYLHERCGAPAGCFSTGEPWPDSIRPADVFRKAHELNFRFHSHSYFCNKGIYRSMYR